MMPKKRVCVDCVAEGITTKRPAPKPGPRCVTHNRERRKRLRSDAWAVRLEATYNITPEQYWIIYESQSGVCAICKRANGKSRRLSVDHDHSCCSGSTSCGNCVRALLCRTCNSILGHLRDEPAAFKRAINVIIEWPAQEVLRHEN